MRMQKNDIQEKPSVEPHILHRNYRYIYRGFLLLIILTLGIGATFIWWSVRWINYEMRTQFKDHARVVADALHPSCIESIISAPHQTNTAIYLHLKDHLRLLKESDSRIHSIYLVFPDTEGSFTFLADGRRIGHEHEAAWGTQYTEAPDALYTVWTDDKENVIGPFTNRWGYFISAAAPVHDPVSGDIIALLVIDAPARMWYTTLVRAGIPALVFTCVLILGVGGISSIYRRRIQSHGDVRHFESLCIVLAGLIITFFATWAAHMRENTAQKHTFDQISRGPLASIARTLRQLSDVKLEALGRFFEYSDEITYEEFHGFTAFLTENSSVRAWAYVAAVPVDEKEEFISFVHSHGLTDFYIWEEDAQGNPTPVSERDIYYPVMYVAPYTGVLIRALGYDYGSEPTRAAALKNAAHTRMPSSTTPVPYVREIYDEWDIRICRAVFGSTHAPAPDGFVVLVPHMHALLAAPHPLLIKHIDYVDASGVRQRIASDANAATTPFDAHTVTRPYLAFDSVFLLHAQATPAFYALYPARAALRTAATGIILTGVLALVTALLVQRHTKLAYLVNSRTQELVNSQRLLRILVDNFPHGFLLALDTDFRYTLAAGDGLKDISLTPEDLIGKKPRDVFPSTFCDNLEIHMRQALKGETVTFTITLDGQIFSETVCPVRDNGVITTLIGVVVNITEQVHQQDHLRTAHNQLLAILESSPFGVVIVDKQQIIRWINPIVSTMAGVNDSEDILGRQRNTLFCPTETVSDIAQNEKQFECQFCHKDGHSFPILKSITPIIFHNEEMRLETFVDISAQKEALRIAEQEQQNLQSIFNAAQVCMFLINTAGNIVEVNDMAATLVRRSKEEMMSLAPGDALKCIHALSVPEGCGHATECARCPIRHTIATVLDKRETVHNVNVVHTFFVADTPTRIFLSVNAAPVILEGKLHVLLVMANITDQKTHEEHKEFQLRFLHTITSLSADFLAATPETFDAILNSSLSTLGTLLEIDRCTIFRFSDDKNRLTATHEWCANDVPSQITLYHDAPVRELPWVKELTCARYPVYIADARAIHENENFDTAIDTRHGLQSVLYLPLIDENNEIIGFIECATVHTKKMWHDDIISLLDIVANTITTTFSRNRSQEHLRVSEQRFRDIFEKTESVAVQGINASRHVIYWNNASTKLYGYTREEAMGHAIETLIVPPHLREQSVQRITTWVLNGIPMPPGELLLQRKDGSRVAVYSTRVMLNNVHTNEPEIYFIHVDLTERKRIEESLKHTNMQLQDALAHVREMAEKADEANRAKSDFLANMSHEIRTPLNGIVGMTDLLAQTTLDDEQQKYADIVLSCSESLLSLINDILDFSKIEARKMNLASEPFSLASLLGEIESTYVETARKKGVEFFCWEDDDVPHHLIGDPERLRQIITNFTDNAVKFTDTGEVVIYVTRPTKISAKHTDGTIMLHFSIRDTGIGIPADKVTTLFQKFTQVDTSTTRKTGGTGLGLAIAKELTSLMGGSVGVSSVEGKGTEFWFTVRLQQQQDAQFPLFTPPTEWQNTRILLAHHIPFQRQIIAQQFISWGMHVTEAENSEELHKAVSDASGSATPFSLILLNDAPALPFPACLSRIRDYIDAAETHVVAMTTHDLLQKWDAEARTLCHARLLKPLHKAEMISLLYSLLGKGTPHEIVPENTPPSSLKKLVPFASLSARILLVEDNYVNRKVTLTILHKLGLHAHAVKNGTEALEELTRESYDLVIMDVHMPVMDGYETTREIRKAASSVQNHKIPIIAMTANVLSDVQKKCHDAGMNDYMAKPVSTQQLRMILSKWLPHNHN